MTQTYKKSIALTGIEPRTDNDTTELRHKEIYLENFRNINFLETHSKFASSLHLVPKYKQTISIGISLVSQYVN